MPQKIGEYDILLGTFNDNKFTWHHVESYKDLQKAYKAFKDYVNSQLKYTDEELLKVWNTGRLDIELRKGNQLLNWVGIYSREVDRLMKEKDKDDDKKDDKKEETKTKDSVDETPIPAGSLIKVKKEWLEPHERDIPYMVIEDRGDRVLVRELREYAKQPLLGTWVWSKDWIYVIDDKLMKDSSKCFTDGFRELTPDECKEIANKIDGGKSYPELLDEYTPEIRSSTLSDFYVWYNRGYLKK